MDSSIPLTRAASANFSPPESSAERAATSRRSVPATSASPAGSFPAASPSDASSSSSAPSRENTGEFLGIIRRFPVLENPVSPVLV